ncbi:ABC transporter permease [Microbacterium sp. Root61]|uniref:iron chelate uptake ABC transporter family permease subunit n=1 Tax=Microbacterium sp. Root61 TaxID=1736570 RepID=UPI0006F8B4E0|nr:iron chelate uptake ABC transporter family permease subunit [Microbacterium sp. Root61]KRA23593.1 ABC transporter permease [Microbacterium sp. Root61]
MRPGSATLASTNARRSLGLALSVVILAATVVASILVGARGISVLTVWETLFAFNGSTEHLIVWELRIPRTVVGLLVGPALGLAGALIQAFTRNPLADPGILGVNAGAGFFVTIAIGLLGITDPRGYVWFALLGAAVVTVLVYLIGSTGPGQATPIRLTLAGVALAAVLGGVASGVSLKFPDVFDSMRFWGAGSIGGRDLEVVAAMAPFILAGIALALWSARSLNALALGDDVGRMLGAHVALTRAAVVVSVTLLAGTATALAGPIAFVGLMIPHMVRWFVGPDQRWILAYSLVWAPILILVSDIVGRVLLPSGELRVGLVTAAVGAPVLIVLARRKSVSGL